MHCAYRARDSVVLLIHFFFFVIWLGGSTIACTKSDLFSYTLCLSLTGDVSSTSIPIEHTRGLQAARVHAYKPRTYYINDFVLVL